MASKDFFLPHIHVFSILHTNSYIYHFAKSWHQRLVAWFSKPFHSFSDHVFACVLIDSMLLHLDRLSCFVCIHVSVGNLFGGPSIIECHLSYPILSLFCQCGCLSVWFVWRRYRVILFSLVNLCFPYLSINFIRWQIRRVFNTFYCKLFSPYLIRLYIWITLFCNKAHSLINFLFLRIQLCKPN